MLGRDGVSQCFMVGVAEIRDPVVVGVRLDALRRDLMGDPYFAGACSLHLERCKTALAFHAKDDLPEVRWRVYERLRRLDIKVAVALRCKVVLEAQARALFQKTGMKLRPDDVYDGLVTQLVPKAGSSQELRNRSNTFGTWTIPAMELGVSDMTVRIWS